MICGLNSEQSGSHTALHMEFQNLCYPKLNVYIDKENRPFVDDVPGETSQVCHMFLYVYPRVLVQVTLLLMISSFWVETTGS